MLLFFNSEHYKNKTWSNTSVPYDKHCFWFNVGGWKLVPGSFKK